jgi:hypothetical protein
MAGESCQANPGLARKSQSLILQTLASVGQAPVAKALDVSEATVSRMKSEQLESFTAFLATLNLKIVPAEHKCYEPAYIEHLHYFAKIGMQMAADTAPTLDWSGQ